MLRRCAGVREDLGGLGVLLLRHVARAPRAAAGTRTTRCRTRRPGSGSSTRCRRSRRPSRSGGCRHPRPRAAGHRPADRRTRRRRSATSTSSSPVPDRLAVRRTDRRRSERTPRRPRVLLVARGAQPLVAFLAVLLAERLRIERRGSPSRRCSQTAVVAATWTGRSGLGVGETLDVAAVAGDDDQVVFAEHGGVLGVRERLTLGLDAHDRHLVGGAQIGVAEASCRRGSAAPGSRSARSRRRVRRTRSARR